MMRMIEFAFADINGGQEILGAEDEYLTRLTAGERLLRAKKSTPISNKEFADFLNGCVLPWTEKEINRLNGILDYVQHRLAKIRLNIGQPISFIKTNGKEEWNSAYSRAGAIILPEARLQSYDNRKLERLIIHEIFHVISRTFPGVRNILYGLLGFNKINEIEIPGELLSRKLTNPDAPYNNYFISVFYRKKKVAVLPVVFLEKGFANVDSGQDILNSVTVKLLVLTKENKSWRVAAKDGNPVLLNRNEVDGLEEQVYSSAHDFFHPEETLAEFFTGIVMGDEGVISLKVSPKIKDILFN